MENIRLHKQLNRMPIEFKKEIGIRFFKEVVYKFNRIHSLEGEVIFTNTEMRDLLKLKDTVDLKQFQKDFHSNDKGIFNAVLEIPEGKSISGGLLLTEVDKESSYIKVVINPLWREFFYSKLDIEKWHSVKGKPQKIKQLEIAVPQKEKLLNMMTSIINHNIKGKYSQRLLDLLMQQKGSSRFIMNWKEFRNVLEIPEKYRASDIDRQVINTAKKELLKANIKITKVSKIKKGKFIERIEILFKNELEEVENKIKRKYRSCRNSGRK